MTRNPTLHLIASTAMGLEGVVSHELRRLGYADAKASNGLVRFTGEPIDIARANLWLRSADRVKVEVGEFEATTFEALFDATRAIPWADLVPADARLPVTGRSVRSALHSVPDCQRIVKKAIVEALREGHKTREWLPEDGPHFPVEVSVRHDRVTLTIDSSGTALHRRGYRLASGDAPLRETLAAALVQLSVWTPDRPFVDPFCGSGTIPIEAALIGRDIAPGAGRHFAASDWPWIGDAAWARARQEVADRADPGRPIDILGSDIDPSMVGMAMENAGRALAIADAARATTAGAADGSPAPVVGTGGRHGSRRGLRFKQMRAEDFFPRGRFGVVVTNPPYGERSGERDEAEALYRGLAAVMGPATTWSTYVYTSHPGFERAFGKPADRRRKLYNGPLEAHFYQYLGERPPRRAAEVDTPPGSSAAGESISEERP